MKILDELMVMAEPTNSSFKSEWQTAAMVKLKQIEISGMKEFSNLAIFETSHNGKHETPTFRVQANTSEVVDSGLDTLKDHANDEDECYKGNWTQTTGANHITSHTLSSSCALWYTLSMALARRWAREGVKQ